MGIAFTLPKLSLLHFATHVAGRSLRLQLDVRGMLIISPADVQHVSTANSTNGRSV